MDVHCQSCNEPWEAYHIRHDAIHETDLSDKDKKAFKGKLTPKYRTAFKAAGWECGAGLFSIRRCPCCPTEAVLNKDRAAMTDVLHDLLGDDLDGIAAEMEDMGL